MRQPEYVWMIEEGVRAELMRYDTHSSVVRYTKYGTIHEVVVENNEFNYLGEEGNDDED